MQYFFARVPLFRLLVPFLYGIGAGYVFHWEISFSVFAGLLLVFSLFIFFHVKLLKRSLRWSGAEGIVITAAFFVCGIRVLNASGSETVVPFFQRYSVKSIHVFLLDDGVTKDRSVKFFGETRSFHANGKWIPSNEKLVVYFARDSNAANLHYGDEILLAAAPQKIDGPKNPGEFDYREWLLRQHVSGQVYARKGSWMCVSRDNGNFFKATAFRLRRYFIGKLEEYGLSGPAFGVASALLLGDSDYLDPQTLHAYSASGTMHVLSVSGMHVALVYVVLLRLLLPFERWKRGKWCSVVLQLLFLWFYATLTGLNPSVLRAVLMMTVVICGRVINRHAHVLNSLCASAMLLLLFDPMLLFDVGFQLSYLAVCGIVTLQPILEKRWEPKTWMMQQVWTLVSVTIVAQLFTFPLGLYYFHQFPSYFILSNLLVIPLATLTMYAGLLLLLLSPFAFVAKFVAPVFMFFVNVLNGAVSFVEHLPGSVIASQGWSGGELFLLYTFILIGIYFLVKKKRRLIFPAGITLCLLLLSFISAENEALHNEKIIVFSIPHGTAIGVINGKQNVLFADTNVLEAKGAIDFHIKPCFDKTGSQNCGTVILNDTSLFQNEFVHLQRSWMCCCGKTIYIVSRKNAKQFSFPHCDILLLRESNRCNLDSFLANMTPVLVVADGSDSKKKIQHWDSVCAKHHIKFYNVQEEGALEVGK